MSKPAPRRKWIEQTAARYLRELSHRVESQASLDDLDREVICAVLRDVASDTDPREQFYVGPGGPIPAPSSAHWEIKMRGATGRPTLDQLRAEIALHIELELARGKKLEHVKARLLMLGKGKAGLTTDQLRRAIPFREQQRRYLDSLTDEERADLLRGVHPMSPEMSTIKDRMTRKNAK